MPILNPNPPLFVPTGRYTAERRDLVDQAHPSNILWPAIYCMTFSAIIIQLSHGIIQKEEDSVEISFRYHLEFMAKSAQLHNRSKLDSGVYEPSNSSYRSRWFCVVKKDTTKVRLVHSLEVLNAATIQHTRVTPLTDQVAEQFTTRACGAMLDLYIAYDERMLAESSRHYTTWVRVHSGDFYDTE